MISRLTKIPEPGRVALMSLCCHPVMKHLGPHQSLKEGSYMLRIVKVAIKTWILHVSMECLPLSFLPWISLISEKKMSI